MVDVAVVMVAFHGVMLIYIFFFPSQSTPTVKSVSQSCTLPRKTSTATSLPPSAGRPSRPPRRFFCPSFPCYPALMTRARRMWKLPACGVRIRPSSRSVCVDACGRAKARSKREFTIHFLFRCIWQVIFSFDLPESYGFWGFLLSWCCSPLHDKASAGVLIWVE